MKTLQKSLEREKGERISKEEVLKACLFVLVAEELLHFCWESLEDCTALLSFVLTVS